jgi:3-oxoacyl-[acyl-carrier-protein] synthase-3
MRTAVVQALEHYLPEGRVTNDDLAAIYPTWTADKILAKTGIQERHVVAPGVVASDLAVEAAEKLFAKTGIDRAEIDLLIYCTQSPDYFLPTTACILQTRLGLGTGTAAFDYNLGCSAFPYGLAIVRGLVDAGVASNALLLMADTYSRYIHPMDRSVRTLFGDAASAVLITAEERSAPSLGPFVLGTDGAGAHNLIVPAGGLREPLAAADLSERTDKSGNVRTAANLYMNGPAIFEFTTRRVPPLVSQLMATAELSLDDVDHVIFHQASEMLLDHLQRVLKIPDSKFLKRFAYCGNTVSSTIPIVLQDAIETGRVKRDDLVLVAGFGVGYSWGANLIRWDARS